VLKQLFYKKSLKHIKSKLKMEKKREIKKHIINDWEDELAERDL
jgi:hypothetical protein